MSAPKPGSATALEVGQARAAGVRATSTTAEKNFEGTWMRPGVAYSTMPIREAVWARSTPDLLAPDEDAAPAAWIALAKDHAGPRSPRPFWPDRQGVGARRETQTSSWQDVHASLRPHTSGIFVLALTNDVVMMGTK